MIQIAGALLILAAFTAAQAGRVDPHSRGYLVLNLAGSSVLAYDALHGEEWGFLLLEAAWAIVSAWSLFQAVVAHPSRYARPRGESL